MTPAPRRLLRRPIVAAACVLALAGCGTSSDLAQPGRTETSAPDPSPIPTTEPTPSPGPAVYDEDDYTYELAVSCFCPDANSYARITVTDGEATFAEWTESGPTHVAGDIAPAQYLVSINDLLATARALPEKDHHIEWPTTSPHPTSISTDPIPLAVDDEVGYQIRNVTATPDFHLRRTPPTPR